MKHSKFADISFVISLLVFIRALIVFIDIPESHPLASILFSVVFLIYLPEYLLGYLPQYLGFPIALPMLGIVFALISFLKSEHKNMLTITSVAMVCLSIFLFLWLRFSDQSIKPSVQTPVPAQSLSCQSLYDEIENDLDKANYCRDDSDCDVLVLGGQYVEFGCYHFVNKNIDKNQFYDKMKFYWQKCNQIINKCAPAPQPSCVSGKCLYKP